MQEKVVARNGKKATGVVPVSPWASRRRQNLLELLDRLTPTSPPPEVCSSRRPNVRTLRWGNGSAVLRGGTGGLVTRKSFQSEQGLSLPRLLKVVRRDWLHLARDGLSVDQSDGVLQSHQIAA